MIFNSSDKEGPFSRIDKNTRVWPVRRPHRRHQRQPSQDPRKKPSNNPRASTPSPENEQPTTAFEAKMERIRALLTSAATKKAPDGPNLNALRLLQQQIKQIKSTNASSLDNVYHLLPEHVVAFLIKEVE